MAVHGWKLIVTITCGDRSMSHAMLETKQLRIFKTVVEVGGFTRAGQRLNLSQPAISQHVRALEKELGVPLLLRIGKATRLTPAGEVLLQCATQVLDKLEEVQRVLAEDGDGRATIVRLGTPEPACVHLVPPLLVEIKRRLPKIDVRITSGHTGATLARLIGGEIDLGLLPLPVEPKRMRITELGRDELVAAVPPDHRWVARRRVQVRDFQDEPVIIYDRQSQITELTLGFLLAEGVFPRVVAEIEHLEAVKEMVQRRLGWPSCPRGPSGARSQPGCWRRSVSGGRVSFGPGDSSTRRSGSCRRRSARWSDCAGTFSRPCSLRRRNGCQPLDPQAARRGRCPRIVCTTCGATESGAGLSAAASMEPIASGPPPRGPCGERT